MVSRKRMAKVKRSCEGKGFGVDVENSTTTYCYCHVLGLTYPHYLAEHTQEMDDNRELRARRAEGSE